MPANMPSVAIGMQDKLWLPFLKSSGRLRSSSRLHLYAVSLRADGLDGRTAQRGELEDTGRTLRQRLHSQRRGGTFYRCFPHRTSLVHHNEVCEDIVLRISVLVSVSSVVDRLANHGSLVAIR
jgi:hypothetical protein